MPRVKESSKFTTPKHHHERLQVTKIQWLHCCTFVGCIPSLKLTAKWPMKRGFCPPTKKKNHHLLTIRFQMRAVRFRGGSFTREVTGYSRTTNLRHGLTRLIWDIHYEPSPWVFPVGGSLHGILTLHHFSLQQTHMAFKP